eukprot:4485136-Ditylum_brightwellii.AAC.1
MVQAISDSISSWRLEEQETAREDNNDTEDKQVGKKHQEDQCMVKEATHHQRKIGWGQLH